MEFSHAFIHMPYLKDGSIKLAEYHLSFRGKIENIKEAGVREYLPLLNKYVRWLAAARRYKKFIVLTKRDERVWRRVLKNTAVIPNAVTVEAAMSASLENKTCIAVGRLAEQKNFSGLLEIWKRVAPKHQDWTLEIYGEGPQREQLEEKCSILGLNDSVKIMGVTARVGNALHAASVCLMTSKYEGLPLVLVEAANAGLPIISYDCPCGPGEIIHEGKNGFLISPGDEHAFALRLEQLMEDVALRKKMGAEGVKIAQDYSPKNVMAMWDGLFRRLMRGGSL